MDNRRAGLRVDASTEADDLISHSNNREGHSNHRGAQTARNTSIASSSSSLYSAAQSSTSSGNHTAVVSPTVSPNHPITNRTHDLVPQGRSGEFIRISTAGRMKQTLSDVLSDITRTYLADEVSISNTSVAANINSEPTDWNYSDINERRGKKRQRDVIMGLPTAPSHQPMNQQLQSVTSDSLDSLFKMHTDIQRKKDNLQQRIEALDKKQQAIVAEIRVLALQNSGIDDDSDSDSDHRNDGYY